MSATLEHRFTFSLTSGKKSTFVPRSSRLQMFTSNFTVYLMRLKEFSKLSFLQIYEIGDFVWPRLYSESNSRDV